MSQKPKVTVVTISYNQEKYIREALESLVTQKVDFKFEIIIADDASSDDTPNIIKKYADKYPEIIKPILRTKNIGAYPNFRDALQHVSGTYLAMCEGDDFWTDPEKLQKQVRFMDANQEYAVCFHPVRVFFENESAQEYTFPEDKRVNEFTVSRLLHDNFIQTNSVMYRRMDYSDMPEYIMPADWYMHLFHAKFGKIGFINEIMAAYRRHDSGLWGGHRDNKQFWKNNGINYLLLHREFLKLFGKDKDRRTIINESTARVFDVYTDLSVLGGDESCLKEAATKFPEFTSYYIARERRRLNETDDVLKAHKQELTQTRETIKLKEKHIRNLENEIAHSKSSSTWKVSHKVRSVLKKKSK